MRARERGRCSGPTVQALIGMQPEGQAPVRLPHVPPPRPLAQPQRLPSGGRERERGGEGVRMSEGSEG